MALRTYVAARQDMLQGLRARGWKTEPNLKYPHATDPYGHMQIWFKAQAVYYGSPGVEIFCEHVDGHRPDVDPERSRVVEAQRVRRSEGMTR